MEQLLDQFLNYLAVERGLSLNTLEAYSRDLNKYLDFLNLKGIKEIETTSDVTIISFIASLKKKGLSNRSIGRNISSIKMFYRFLSEGHHITNNPAGNIEPPKGTSKLPHILSIERLTCSLKNPT